eukprot:2974683-Pyramimonas_sp.AAC.4
MAELAGAGAALPQDARFIGEGRLRFFLLTSFPCSLHAFSRPRGSGLSLGGPSFLSATPRASCSGGLARCLFFLVFAFARGHLSDANMFSQAGAAPPLRQFDLNAFTFAHIARLPPPVELQALGDRGPYLRLPPREPRRRAEEECLRILPAGAKTYSPRMLRRMAWDALMRRHRGLNSSPLLSTLAPPRRVTA